jgi:hypothetical protein
MMPTGQNFDPASLQEQLRDLAADREIDSLRNVADQGRQCERRLTHHDADDQTAGVDDRAPSGAAASSAIENIAARD